jgi:hypothetical protein
MEVHYLQDHPARFFISEGKPSLGKTSVMYKIVSARMTWEEFTRAEDILREKVQNFHIGKRKDAKSRLKSLRKWVYILLLVSTAWSVFVVWYILHHR